MNHNKLLLSAQQVITVCSPTYSVPLVPEVFFQFFSPIGIFFKVFVKALKP